MAQSPRQMQRPVAVPPLATSTTGRDDHALVVNFSLRALVAGAITAALGAVAAALGALEVPTLWRGLIGRALPFTLGAVLIGLATAVAPLIGSYRIARILVAAETACIFIAWGVAQWPYLIVPDVTIQNAASPASVLVPMLVVALVGLVILVPALWYLFSVFKLRATPTGSTGSRLGATTASFVATLPSPVATTSPWNSIEASSIQPHAFGEVEAVLAFSFALVAASLIGRVVETLRLRSARRSVSARK